MRVYMGELELELKGVKKGSKGDKLYSQQEIKLEQEEKYPFYLKVLAGYLVVWLILVIPRLMTGNSILGISFVFGLITVYFLHIIIEDYIRVKRARVGGIKINKEPSDLLGSGLNNVDLDKDELNMYVLVGKETKDSRVLAVRRLYAILHVDELGNIYLTEDCRTLRGIEEYRKTYCTDIELGDKEFEQFSATYKTIIANRKVEEELRKHKEVQELQRKELEEELKIQKQYLREYDSKHNLKTLPNNLAKERESLNITLKTIKNKLEVLESNLEDLPR